jgi:hypothetical protein
VTAKLRHRAETHHAIVGEPVDERIDVPGHEQRLHTFNERFGLFSGTRVAIAFLPQWLNDIMFSRLDVLQAVGFASAGVAPRAGGVLTATRPGQRPS